MQRFGEKLKTLRKRRKLTLRDAGALLDVYHTFVSQMESGRKTPNAAMLLKIADLFGVTTDQLMRDDLDV